MISNKIVHGKELPGWMYREYTERDGDSGWRVFSGTEDEEYMDDPYNFSLISTAQMIEIDTTLKVNLLAPFNYSFERNVDGEWVIVDIPTGN